jgi:branched-subunit amino acid permease
MTNTVPAFRSRLLLIGLLSVFLGQPAWAAGDIRTERVQFAKGANSATVEGTIKGYQTVDYVLHASK